MAPLLIETEEERRLFQKGEENYNAKKALRKRSFLEQAPDQDESNMIHSMWTTGQPYKGKIAQALILGDIDETTDFVYSSWCGGATFTTHPKHGPNSPPICHDHATRRSQ